MRNTYFKNKIFLKLFTSYVVSVLIPISIIGILTSCSVFQMIKNDYRKLNTHIIEQYQKDINLNLKTTNLLAMQLSKNAAVKSFLGTSFSSATSKAYNAKKVADEIFYYNVTSELSDACGPGIYSSLNNLIICAASMYTPKEYFDLFCKDIDCTYEEWLKLLQSINSQTYISSHENSKFLQLQPLYREDPSLGVFINMITHQNLFSELKTVSSEDKLNFIIIDKSGKELMSLYNFDKTFDISLFSSASDNISFSMNGKKYIGKYSVANAGNLIYVYLIENGNLFSNMNTIFLAFFGLILICLIFCLYIAYKNTLNSYRPFNKLINDKDLLSTELNKQREIIRSSVLSNLIYSAKSYTEKNLLDYGIEFSMKNYSVLIISHIPSQNESEIESDELINSIIFKKFDKLLRERHIELSLVTSNDRKYVCILNFNNAFPDSTVNDFIEHIYKDYEIRIIIALGKITDSFNDLIYSFESSSIAFNYALRNDVVTCCKYEDVKNKLSNNINFPKEKKEVLQSLIKTGQLEKTAAFVDEIYKTSCAAHQLDDASLNTLNKKMFATLLELTDEIKLTENDFAGYTAQIVSCMEQKNFLTGFNRFRELCLELCRQAELLTAPDKIILKNVFRYIEENYADSALSLRDMSDYLGINYSLLSRRIKEQTGAPFIEHLNKHRLHHASLLLKNSSASIEEIARAVGYESSNTFSKTFKKYYFQTPTQYRNSFSDGSEIQS